MKRILFLIVTLATCCPSNSFSQICIGPGQVVIALPGVDLGDNVKVGEGQANNEAWLSVEGGTVGDNMMVKGSGNVLMSDGSIGNLGSMRGTNAFGIGQAFLQMTGGELGTGFLIDDDSEANICGGHVEPSLTLDGLCLLVPGEAQLNVFGVEREDSLSAVNIISGIMNIHGTDLEISNAPRLLMAGETVRIDDRGAGVFMTGCYVDGTEFSFELNNMPGGEDFFGDPLDGFNDFEGVCLSFHDAVEPVESFQILRGFPVSGGLDDLQDSDDDRLVVEPGFVLNNTEAPVWIVFDGRVNGTDENPLNDPEIVTFVLESHASTPGLELTIEMFNWNTLAWEVVAIEPESFGVDKFHKVNISDRKGDFVNPLPFNDNQVRARVGWRQTGFVINFPWQVRIDQAGWMAGCESKKLPGRRN